MIDPVGGKRSSYTSYDEEWKESFFETIDMKQMKNLKEEGLMEFHLLNLHR